jgi:hypothetical protein
MAGGAETPNIAALPAIARLGACESARGPDADRHVKLLIQFAVEGACFGADLHRCWPGSDQDARCGAGALMPGALRGERSEADAQDLRLSRAQTHKSGAS